MGGSLLQLHLLCWLSLPWFGSSLSQFLGNTKSLSEAPPLKFHHVSYSSGAASLTMRKQKASNRRTRRAQRGGGGTSTTAIGEPDEVWLIPGTLFRGTPATAAQQQGERSTTLTNSPMQTAGTWNLKSKRSRSQFPVRPMEKSRGRGRSRKRATLYNRLSTYHNTFLALLTAEYQAEEKEIVDRIKASVDDPLGMEIRGHVVYDMFPERRGNLFSNEVYRLTKAKDATVAYDGPPNTKREEKEPSPLPPNHKFSRNDVIVLTLQPAGSGDFFDVVNLPTSSRAISVEGRVIGTGPTYLDIAVAGGRFESAFGPAPNNKGSSGRGDPHMRLRADRFFSEIPYSRMVDALTQMTSISKKKKETNSETPANAKKRSGGSKHSPTNDPHINICMDDVFKEVVISTHAFVDPQQSSSIHETGICDLVDFGRRLAKPPMPDSMKLANQALSYMQKNAHGAFIPFNGPQLAAIGAALTRKLTLVQGPPGTGKTATASAIGFGFTHQCRSISPNAKVLACAFSNIGADNLAEGLLKLGLKVVRVGSVSAISEHLWEHTLEAAIDQDPKAKQALEDAAKATAQLTKARQKSKGTPKSQMLDEETMRQIATSAVQRSIQACNIAATHAFRDADVIVSTSTGAADPRLLAACGLSIDASENTVPKRNKDDDAPRTAAPDGRPPISLPFVIVDEACQSVEPATLIPLTASNSCRSMVLLGDPCQLPATVRHDHESMLSVSLMERLAMTLPAPMINMKKDISQMDSSYLEGLAMKQARSLLRTRDPNSLGQVVYRKRFAGSLLLSIQYRMHPSIAAFSSSLFYNDLLGTPMFLANFRPFPEVLKHLIPSSNSELAIRLINVGGRNNESRGESKPSSGPSTATTGTLESTTFRNEAEARVVVDLVKTILQKQSANDQVAPKSIGIISPYSGQVHLIRRMLSTEGVVLPVSASNGMSIEVNSVDGYQGREQDIIIFSAVRSNNRPGAVGFLADWRRLNVALTRARNALIVVGDTETLTEGNIHWAAFHKWCDGLGCVVNQKDLLQYR